MAFRSVSSLLLSSLTIVAEGSSLTIFNEGLSLTIINKTTNFLKTVVFENDRFFKAISIKNDRFVFRRRFQTSSSTKNFNPI